ncbi:MAG: hypothetical protein EOM67_11445 [Spirochaetia bacterium]|nr:hypothetical protein [Spirochaetia bacterium]
MKKILIPILLITLLFITIGCEQSQYAMKTLIVKNESDINLGALSIGILDGLFDYRGYSPQGNPIIYAGDSKEYTIAYIITGEESPQIRVETSSMSELGERGVLLTPRVGSPKATIYFTFDTSSNEDIILTFQEEVEDPSSFSFSGEGSGFKVLSDD